MVNFQVKWQISVSQNCLPIYHS